MGVAARQDGPGSQVGLHVEASNCDVHGLLQDRAERVSAAFKDDPYSPCAAGSFTSYLLTPCW